MRCVRVIRTSVHFQLAVHGLAELRFRQHAVHRVLDQLMGFALAHEPGALFAQPAFVAAVLAINLLVFFAAGELDLGRVDDDDVIAGVDEGRVGRLVLALKEPRRNGGDATQHLPVGIDDVPADVVGRVLRVGHERRHS